MRIMISRFLFIFLVWNVDAQQLEASKTSPYFPSLRNYDPSFAPVIVALGCSFLFVLFFAFFLRHCSDPDLSVTDLPVVTLTTPTIINYTPHHHEPQGIDPKLLDTFPIIMYCNLKDMKLDGILSVSIPLECAICLTEFEYNDMLRMLPKCKHAFHPYCIRKWLASHVTCPVCRAVVEEDVAVVVVRNEVNDETPVVEEIVRQTEVRTSTREVSCGERVLRRCHSTGHSLDLRMREDLRKQIMGWSNHLNYEDNDDDDDDDDVVVLEGRQDEGSSGGLLSLFSQLQYFQPREIILIIYATPSGP